MYIYRNIVRLFDRLPDTVKQKLCGVMFVALGVLSAIVSKDNGVYDITAALLFVPLGLCMVFGKFD